MDSGRRDGLGAVGIMRHTAKSKTLVRRWQERFVPRSRKAQTPVGCACCARMGMAIIAPQSIKSAQQV
jgi:hypothetical protein